MRIARAVGAWGTALAAVVSEALTDVQVRKVVDALAGTSVRSPEDLAHLEPKDDLGEARKALKKTHDLNLWQALCS
eukprot:9938607-Alexandrium_andersonii.AAC.1